MIQTSMSKKKKCILIALSSMIIALLAGWMAVRDFPMKLEYMAQNSLYQNPGLIPDDIKIIAIDEETLSKLGPYSNWNRSYFARLLSLLNADSEKAPKVIGVDVVFSGTDYSENDTMLVEACKGFDNIVMASVLNLDTRLYQEDGEYYREQFVSVEGKPYEALAEVVEYGFTNAIIDDDGVVRKFYTRMQYVIDGKAEVYDSFSNKIAKKAGATGEYASQVEAAFVGKPGDFETYSMIDVLEGKVPAEYFADCIVLIGAYEEGMRDSYRVSIDYANEMYGVEMQANYIHSLLSDRLVYPVSGFWNFLITFFLVGCISFCILNIRLRNAIIGMLAGISVYVFAAWLVFQFSYYKLNVLAVPAGIILAFLLSCLYRYLDMQKKRVSEMQGMLFSMAEAMAETIEGRTPYNANHTKNVAKRCVEMLDYINLQNKTKRTELYFSPEDKRQLYLAAMLHDVGKMDIPLEVMDKPTKLGNREKDLRARLEIITLRIENDALTGRMDRAQADAKQEKIRDFAESLGAFNCGRPLKEEEWALVNEIAESVYVDADKREIPYLTEEEKDDLRIKAGTLSEQERFTMQSHVTYTDKILSHVQFGEHFDKVRAMASNHHELLNGKGYPKGLGEEELDVMTRILTIMDIYDSLIADDRPYKKAKPIKVAFDILDEEAAAGKIDKELLVYAKELYLVEE